MDSLELMRANVILCQNLHNMNLWRLKSEEERDYFKRNFEYISQEFKKYIENENAFRAKRERIIEELTEDLNCLFKENKKFEREFKEIEEKMKINFEQDQKNYLKQIKELTEENKKLLAIINNLKQTNCLGQEDYLSPLGTLNLFHAAEEGNMLASKFWINIIETSIHIREKNTHNTPLHIAASHGHVLIIEYFISIGANINAENNLKERPLYCAAFNGHPSACKILIENGAEINAQTKTGITALQSAFLNYHWEVVEFLISYGANFENPDYLGYRLLHYSVIREDLTLIKLLVEKGVSINAIGTSNGKTPLHLAYEGGQNKIIKYLILNGANENIPDFEGKIPEEYDKIWMEYNQKNI